ncbi:hypothetical protein FHW79_005333 [Azospirillum sp. OGB3]|uniref:hypothetical protein n=1 Tax=Azospirillum sp. OGB3 TaxID=2587012 RepID=UPI001605EBA2|nr:hypothetical protein [Azospirillum sp. OGB3]MBB3267668.1 hypothetical protein [Azospirillum sp. OGB3]
MSKRPTTITLTWRDENYGSIHRASAFRVAAEPVLTGAARKKLVQMFQQHFFSFHTRRNAWIAEGCPDNAPGDLSGALAAAGYTVAHAGCVPPPDLRHEHGHPHLPAWLDFAQLAAASAGMTSS